MKNRLILLLATVTLLAAPLIAQTNEPPPIVLPPSRLSLDFMTNLPTAQSFQVAKFGFSAGILVNSGKLENTLKADMYFRTNWMASAEIQNGPTSTVIDAFSLYGGYRQAWLSAEVYAQAGARRTWTSEGTGKPTFQGVALIGASYLPMTGAKFMIGTEMRATTSPHGSVLNTQPAGEFVVFTKLLF